VIGKTFIVRSASGFYEVLRAIREGWLLARGHNRPLVVTIEEEFNQRTIAQNRRLHAIIGQIADQAVVNGRLYTPGEWKEQIRRKFIGTTEIELPDGTCIEVGISTTTLSVDEFQTLMDKVEAWAATDLGLELDA
jgi:hypothetical protein